MNKDKKDGPLAAVTNVITSARDIVASRIPDLDARAVFVHPIAQDGRCGCGNAACKAKAGKHTNWRPAGAGTPYGIKTGAGIAVLDLDLKGRDLPEVVALVEGQFGPLPETLMVETGSGGLHIFFAVPMPVRNRSPLLGPGSGVDFKGDGGMVIGAGSPHASGSRYVVVLDAPLAPIPQALLALVAKTATGAMTGDSTPWEAPIQRGHRYYRRAVARAVAECKGHEPAREGGGGHATLLGLARKLWVLGISRERAEALAWKHYNPRCSPPWPEGDADFSRKFGEVYSSRTWGDLESGLGWEAVEFLERRKAKRETEAWRRTGARYGRAA